jgi:hypothetical protein
METKVIDMKIEDISKGDIFQNISNKKADVITSANIYEVIRVINGEEGGYKMSTILLGNLSSKEGMPVNLDQLSDQHTWKQHLNARHMVVHQLILGDGTVLELNGAVFTSKQNPVVQCKNVDEALDNLIVRQENIDSDLDALAETPASSSSNPDTYNYSDHTNLINYSSSASYRYDDLELLCMQFGHVCKSYRSGSRVSILDRRPPRRNCQSFLVHETEWFNFKNNQKSIREIRDMKLWISPYSNNGMIPCSYRRIISRILQAALWFGNKQDKALVRQHLSKG